MYATVEPQIVDTSALESLTDNELIVEVRGGNDDALGALLRRHQEGLYRFCLHLTKNRDDAEDVCQEAMARAITHVDRLNASEKFRSWLFSIARNLSIDSHRSRKRLCALPDDDYAPIQLYGDDVQEQIEASEEHQTVAEALRKLAKSHQHVLMLREVEGLSYAEIAQRLDVSQSAVETLLFRARKRLREEYGKKAPAPAFGLLAGIRGVFSRLASPFSGAPLLGKAAISLTLLGGVAMTAPHVSPVFSAVMGDRSSPTQAVPAQSGARESGRSGLSVSKGERHSQHSVLSPLGLTRAGSKGTAGRRGVSSKTGTLGARGEHAGPGDGTKATGDAGSPASAALAISGTIHRGASSKGTAATGSSWSTVVSTASAASSSGPSPRGGNTVNTTTSRGPSGSGNQVGGAVGQVQSSVQSTTNQVQTTAASTGSQVQSTVSSTTGSATTTVNNTTSSAQTQAAKTTGTVQTQATKTTGTVQNSTHSATSQAQSKVGSTTKAASGTKVPPVATPTSLIP